MRTGIAPPEVRMDSRIERILEEAEQARWVVAQQPDLAQHPMEHDAGAKAQVGLHLAGGDELPIRGEQVHVRGLRDPDSAPQARVDFEKLEASIALVADEFHMSKPGVFERGENLERLGGRFWAVLGDAAN